jgi:hypothetical protein
MTPEIPWPVHPAAELFPLITTDELAELADDIDTHGLLEPVWLYDDPDRGTVILDGRNRVMACALAEVEVETRYYEGADPIGFSISQNLKRRHLTIGQKAAVAHAALPLFEEEGRRRMAAAAAEENRRRAEAARRAAEQEAVEDEDDQPGGADLHHPVPVQSEAEPPTQTRAPRSTDRAATATGASGRAVAQFKRLAEQAPDLAAKVRSGELALDRAERIVRDREAEQRRVTEAQAQAAAQPVVATVDVRHGDFREVLADLRDVDAIITDPPYPREYLPLLDDLAAWSDKVLAEDGVLVVLFGQTHLPEVYRRLDGHRPYRWTGCYFTPGNGYVSMARHVQSNWKPFLVYGGGPRFADVVRSEGSDAGAKSLHHWGQDYGAFHTLVERFTKPGQTVVDPFAGAGTTLLAAKALGRHAVGAELDEEHVQTARERVA